MIHNEYYFEMLDILAENQVGVLEKHHVIPRSYLKKYKLNIPDKFNLISLSLENHFRVHYCLWKCCPEIQQEMELCLLNFSDTRNFNFTEYSTLRENFINSLKKPVVCLESKIIYSSIKEAEEVTGIKHISSVVNGRRKSAGGLHWQFYNGENDFDTSKLNKKCEKRIRCIETGKEYNSLNAASLDTGICKSTISKQLNGKRKSGYHWENLDD